MSDNKSCCDFMLCDHDAVGVIGLCPSIESLESDEICEGLCSPGDDGFKIKPLTLEMFRDAVDIFLTPIPILPTVNAYPPIYYCEQHKKWAEDEYKTFKSNERQIALAREKYTGPSAKCSHCGTTYREKDMRKLQDSVRWAGEKVCCNARMVKL